MISVGTRPHVRVDETSTEEKQDLLSLDVNHQYKNMASLQGDERDTDKNKYHPLALSVCVRLFRTEHVYQHIQILMITHISWIALRLECGIMIKKCFSNTLMSGDPSVNDVQPLIHSQDGAISALNQNTTLKQYLHLNRVTFMSVGTRRSPRSINHPSKHVWLVFLVKWKSQMQMSQSIRLSCRHRAHT